MTLTNVVDEAYAERGDTGIAAERSLPWRDELVELMVLAEHVDRAASSRLAGWLSVDPAAREVSARVRRDVDTVRTG